MGKIVRVTGPGEPQLPDDVTLVYTVSKASGWSKWLSPFFLGPVDLYANYKAQNVENAWQYCKVYPYFIGPDGNPTAAYFRWALQGWESQSARRYPAGKGVQPAYSWWDGERLGYIEARKKIYIPLYSRAVRKTHAYAKLRELYQSGERLFLWDYDGYDNEQRGMSLKDVANDPTRSMGHAFILKKMLESGI